MSAVLAALAGCGNGAGSTVPPAAVAAQAVAPTASPSGFIDVPYDHYEEAALQTGIAPGAVAKEVGFSAGLADLCDNSSDDYVALVDNMRSEASRADDPVNSLDQRLDEVDLRVALACSYRMADWISARGGAEMTDGLYPSVSPAPGPSDVADDGTAAPDYDDYEADYTESHGDGDGAEETSSPGPEDSGTSSVHIAPYDSSSSDSDGARAGDSDSGDSDSGASGAS